MTAPQREAQDVPDVLMDWLGPKMAVRFPELDVLLELPAKWKPHTSRPCIVISDDGDPMGLPVQVGTTPTTRLTSWTTGRDRRYIHAAMAYLLTTPIPRYREGVARHGGSRREGPHHRGGSRVHNCPSPCSASSTAVKTDAPKGHSQAL